ncbi:hypothetical protein [Methylocystis sp. SB2]|uniref:hypothetical protein n=1 Tax=Methylocystis sp. (strain SB2) TaxID=743836 RepID=UPI0012EE8869|nr:hypothetical protein [Methylocystis sp. SB2]ULO24674.1 hypothetical protein LNB28_04565 [Methylocystis sp. SB2]
MAELKRQELQIPLFPQNVPLAYCNGFITNVGAADVSIVLLLDGTPSLKLHMSYTSAKTLREMLVNAVEALEKATDHKIMVSSEVEAGLKKLSEEAN